MLVPELVYLARDGNSTRGACDCFLCELRLLQQSDPALLQPVSDDVELLAAINPRRECAAEMRLHFNPGAKASPRRTPCFLIATKILGEVDRFLINLHQSFARSALRVNDVMGFELDVKELQFIECVGVIERDRRAVN